MAGRLVLSVVESAEHWLARARHARPRSRRCERVVEDQVRVHGGQKLAKVVSLAAELEHFQRGAGRLELTSALASGTGIVVADLTSTTFCDTSGVQEILLAHKAAVAGGVALRVVVPARLGLQFTWTGIDQVLAVYPCVPAALAPAETAEG